MISFDSTILLLLRSAKNGKMFFIETCCTNSKQWPLAGEFVEFEYSPKIRHFWRVRVLAKTAIFRNMRDSPDSNSPKITFHDTRQTRILKKLYFTILAKLATFAKPYFLRKM